MLCNMAFITWYPYCAYYVIPEVADIIIVHCQKLLKPIFPPLGRQVDIICVRLDLTLARMSAKLPIAPVDSGKPSALYDTVFVVLRGSRLACNHGYVKTRHMGYFVKI